MTSFVDRTLTCSDCSAQFTFTVGEQEFYQSRGFTNEPRRCPECRAARKAARGEGGGGGGGGGYRSYDSNREMFSAVCAECGREARVPFQPRGRPSRVLQRLLPLARTAARRRRRWRWPRPQLVGPRASRFPFP